MGGDVKTARAGRARASNDTGFASFNICCCFKLSVAGCVTLIHGMRPSKLSYARVKKSCPRQISLLVVFGQARCTTRNSTRMCNDGSWYLYL